jgi:dihydroorotate dehydrogenase (NAD+) catalytic subunit
MSKSARLNELTDLAQELVRVQSEQGPATEEAFDSQLDARPPFDHLRDFWFNFADGPRDGVPALEPDAPVLPTRLLNFELDFPFGVPACALTPHSGYIEYFARRGFDLLTYKTVRDRPWNPHPFPQWAFAPSVTSPFSEGDLDQQQIRELVVATLDPREVADLPSASLVNSFGVPCLPTEQWKADVAESKAILSSGQVLIVSVMGSPDGSDTHDDNELVRQFASTAAEAADSGADIVELNLSCPNTGGDLICTKPELSAEVAKAVKQELRGWGVPIFIKIAHLQPSLLRDVVTRCQDHIEGIVAINTVPAKTVDATGKEFFSSYRRPDGRVVHRPTAGLSGCGIRSLGVGTARELVKLREKQRAESDWVIIGVGGVASPADFKSYLDEGVDAVQSCSGTWLNPQLAAEIRNEVGRSPREGEIRDEAHTVASVFAKVGDLLASGGLSTRSRR